MTSLPKRLRAGWDELSQTTLDMAANEIERLQAENAKLRKHAEAMAKDLQQANDSGEWGFISHGHYRADFPKEPDK